MVAMNNGHVTNTTKYLNGDFISDSRMFRGFCHSERLRRKSSHPIPSGRGLLPVVWQRSVFKTYQVERERKLIETLEVWMENQCGGEGGDKGMVRETRVPWPG